MTYLNLISWANHYHLVNQEMLFCFSVAIAGVELNTVANLLAKK
jgi:hypothetical protein